MSKLLWLYQHRQEIGAAIMGVLVAWIPIATLLARYIRRPGPEAAWWKRALFDLAIDTPALVATLERVGIRGGLLNLPGVPSRSPEVNPTPAASKLMQQLAERPPSDFGPDEDTKTTMRKPASGGGGGGGSGGTVVVSTRWRGDDDSNGGTLLLLAVGFAGMLLAGAGCATAVKQTVVAEDGLARAVSVGYRTFDKYDAGKMGAIDALATSGDAAKVKQARADLDEYKPKKTKALATLDTSADLIEAADKARQALELGTGDTKNFTSFLPLLVGALLDLKQALADVGGLL